MSVSVWFRDLAGALETIVEYARNQTVFSQGDPCENVLCIQKGGVKLSRGGRGHAGVLNPSV